MDIARPSSVAAARKKRRILIGTGAVVIIVLVTIGLSRLEPAAPSVEKGTVWVDTVKRGPMLRQVRGTGTLVPEEIRWIPATTEGRVERIVVLPGKVVEPDTVLIELSNPTLEVAAQDAASELKAAESESTNLDVQLQSQLLTQKAAAAGALADYRQASMQSEADEVLAKDGLVADITMRVSRLRAEELKGRSEIEQQRVEMAAQAAQAQLAVQKGRVDRARAAWQLRKSQVDALKVKAGVQGVLQQIPVEVGQQVSLGTNLARVAEPGHLKAEVRVAETQARDIVIGQVASIDTRNGIVPGKVSRIDPAVQNGTVTVDVALEGPLPRGARPDLSVDGTIELERLESVLFVGRPAFGGEQSTLGLFRLEVGGAGAKRVQVKVGRSSVNTVEILEGLNEGDQVILSDMSAWDAFDRVRLN
ncbi:MAG: efflux RND transporter periplasmic adaptor subunit [Acidobacteria bacterium]|nr:efflux RND transporter periplasmic adaptor subunit [Acidobacteriota bacterium]MCI0567906.1 efflux RND transporter periplasmic adaptor subunit [Acidobacteriota bacterium]